MEESFSIPVSDISQAVSHSTSNSINAHFFLPARKLESLPLSYAPIKKRSQDIIDIEMELQNVIGRKVDNEEASRLLIASGTEKNFELLGRMASARLIHDWEGLARFVIKYCKDQFLCADATQKRFAWVCARATTPDIAAVAKEYASELSSLEEGIPVSYGFRVN
jgi:hypothetical protein